MCVQKISIQQFNTYKFRSTRDRNMYQIIPDWCIIDIIVCREILMVKKAIIVEYNKKY